MGISCSCFAATSHRRLIVMKIMSHSWEKEMPRETNMDCDESLKIKRCHQREEDAYFIVV